MATHAASGQPPSAARRRAQATYLRNLTGGPLTVIGDGHEVHLPPLGQVELTREQAAGCDEHALHNDPRVQFEDDVSSHAADRASTALGAVSMVSLLLAIGAGLVVGSWLVGGLTYLVALAVGVLGSRQVTRVGASVIVRWLVERALLVLVVVVGFGSALVAAWLANLGPVGPTEAFDDVDVTGIFLVSVQALFLGFAITFPALLYFFFERQRADALRTRFLLNLFRLDNRLTTVTDVEARYGARMQDVFGEERSLVRQTQRRSPILISTAVLSVSLVAAFINLSSQRAAAGVESEVAGSSLLSVLTPTAEVLPFAFLGAYLYALNTALRGYLRGDLRPKAYSQIAARMLTVVALAALLSAFVETEAASWTDRLLLTAAFFVGLIPNTFITRIFEYVRRVLSLQKTKVGEPQPLTALQGIDLYDRARLEQEGVTNVEALVHGDLIDLMTQTRIPAGRLVDWLDQAVLHLYTPPVPGSAGSRTPEAGADGEDPDEPDQPGTISDLVAERIRTASQLLEAAGYRFELQQDGISTAIVAPDQTPTHARGLMRRYRHVVQGVATEPCMRRVLCWKADRAPAEGTIDARCATPVDVVRVPVPRPESVS